jgi:hypothetical protein
MQTSDEQREEFSFIAQAILKLCFIDEEKDMLKRHGNEADFLGFLHKPVRHRSLTLRFEQFRFWLQIREAGSRQDCL